ncbi:MAG: hypothetical protein Q4Q22_09455, partial [Methanosphaera sp.]|nr:hypothetical protein [Methanosphaera sp.]
GELYRQRWEIEVNYDRLKNKADLENYSGKLELTIKQDFHAKILLYNITMALKQDAEKHIPRTISKNKKRRYQINISTALNLTKDILIDLLKTTNEFRDLLLENLIDEMTDDLSSSLTDPPSIERIIRDITNKFPGNIKRA